MTANKAVPVPPELLLGKSFGQHGLDGVRCEIAAAPGSPRAEIARRVCLRLGWRTPGGSPSLMSARVALLRLHRLGLIELPPPRNGNANGRRFDVTKVPEPFGTQLECPLHQLHGLTLQPVLTADESALYNTLLERHHYLGFVPMAGAQLRYLIRWRDGCLGVLGFGAAAWRVQDRDRFIGWDEPHRKAHLHRVVGNARFLILPWVRCPNLASKALALAVSRLSADFQQRYGYSPVLVESFVEEDRFAGTAYRAANWLRVGRTQGRGKLGQWQDPRVPRKAIWVYPLHSRFRQILNGASTHR